MVNIKVACLVIFRTVDFICFIGNVKIPCVNKKGFNVLDSLLVVKVYKIYIKWILFLSKLYGISRDVKCFKIFISEYENF